MRLTALTVSGFKNLKDVSLHPDAHYNVIVGENAQGKTNLLEAIWILSGCRSFRGTRERDYLCFADSGPMQIQAAFDDGRRVQTITCTMQPSAGKEKRFLLNGIPVTSTGSLFDLFHCVAFTPEDLALINEGPEVRRNFVDLCYSQLTPRAVGAVRRYQMILQQRNAVLKQALPAAAAQAYLDVWDRQLAKTGAYLTVQRSRYLQQLAAVCTELYGAISAQQEAVTLRYQANVFGRDPDFSDCTEEQLAAQYYEKLVRAREEDRALGFTTCGVHRDEMQILINGVSAREFGSQGQKKSLALTLRLAHAQIYARKWKQTPLILLDDVMGELDQNRQQVVYTIVKDMQVFLTTCHVETLIPQWAGQQILLKSGRICPD